MTQAHGAAVAHLPRDASAILAFWCRTPSRPNFGDALTPWLAKRITGRHPVFVRPDDPRPKYVVAGSIIAYATAGTIVWGAGILHKTDVIARGARLRAVRGPLTRARAIECGVVCPDVLGDPGLLLPRFCPPATTRGRGIGVLPHFSDMPRLAAAWRRSTEVHLIDPQAPVERVVDEITACACILSSSLHGLVVSHAYGIPAAWIKFRDLPSGDDSKFDDHRLAVGVEPVPAVRVEYASLDAERLVRYADRPPRVDVDALWRACPFRL